MSKVSSSYFINLETNMQSAIEDNFKRVSSALTWDRIMKTRPSATKKEIVIWVNETARIRQGDADGRNRFDDMSTSVLEFENADAGTSLELTENEIEDNEKDVGGGRTMPVLDFAASWSRTVAGHAAYWPQGVLAQLILNGGSALAYTGSTFFNASHAIVGGGTYSNIVSGVPIDGSVTDDVARVNFAKAIAAVSGQKMLGGVPRMLRPSCVVVPSQLKYRAELLCGAKIIGATDNVVTRGYDFADPMVMPELDGAATTYYLGCEDLLSDDLGAFGYSDRLPFSVRGYSGMTDAELGRMEVFQWKMKGRNAGFYGHPYLFVKCTA